jgi:hypothetical protein
MRVSARLLLPGPPSAGAAASRAAPGRNVVVIDRELGRMAGVLAAVRLAEALQLDVVAGVAAELLEGVDGEGDGGHVDLLLFWRLWRFLFRYFPHIQIFEGVLTVVVEFFALVLGGLVVFLVAQGAVGLLYGRALVAGTDSLEFVRSTQNEDSLSSGVLVPRPDLLVHDLFQLMHFFVDGEQELARLFHQVGVVFFDFFNRAVVVRPRLQPLV